VASDINISVFLKGDLNGGRKWYYLEGKYTTVGYPARFFPHEECGVFVQEDFVMSATRFNNVVVDGKLDLQMRPFRNDIDPGTCSEEDGNQAYIKLSYMYRYCELPPSTSSSVPSQTPTSEPSLIPSAFRSDGPSSEPSTKSSSRPSSKPFPMPSEQPSLIPSCPMLLYSRRTEPGTMKNKGETLLFPFTDLPMVASDVNISVFLKGDLNGGREWYYLEGEYTTVGYPARFVTYEECGAFVQEDFVMSAAIFNDVAMDGKFDLQMRPFRTYIDPGTCSEEDESQAYIELSYMYRHCELPPSTSSSELSSLPSQQPST
jgi:hypothetical protein